MLGRVMLAVAAVLTAFAIVPDADEAIFKLRAALMDANFVNGRVLPEQNTPPEVHSLASPLVSDKVYVTVDLVVDKKGNVALVSFGPMEGAQPPSDLRRQIVDHLKVHKFKPLLDADGQAITAGYSVSITILPPPREPPQRVTFPGGPVSTMKVTLERGTCLMSCPTYHVTIAGDGQARYAQPAKGRDFERETRVSPEALNALVAAFRAADFYSLEDSYRTSWLDGPTYTLTFEIGGVAKTVIDNGGENVGMPCRVDLLERMVDEVAQVQYPGEPGYWPIPPRYRRCSIGLPSQ